MHIDTARYQFIADALKGAGGFRPAVRIDASGNAVEVGQTALVAYPRESEAKFARRNEVAWYENHLLPACQRFVGYLTKKPPMRDLQLPLLQDFTNDCNWRGEDIDVFWHGFMIQAKARGTMFLIVDMPRTLPDNAADQRAERAFPYLVAIAPERAATLAVDFRGRITKFEYHDSDAVGKAVIRGWDSETWWMRDGGKTIESGNHPLGICPVLAFSEDGEIPCVGPFAQIADLSRRLFNARSELDEILRAQTFSLLTYHVPPEREHTFKPGEVAEAVGTHNMLVHHGDAPAFIAPPDGPANTYLLAIAHLEQAIARVALAVELPERQGAESGLALTIRFQSLNAALTGFARRMEDIERRAWDIVARWLGLNSTATIEWAKDYALADLAAELQALADMVASGMPDAVLDAQKRLVVQLSFSTLPNEDMQALLDAISEPASEIGGSGTKNATEPPSTTADQQTAPATQPAPVIDLTPIAEAIAGIKAPDVRVEVAAPIINIPEQPAPVVNISPAVVNVTVPEAAPPAAPSVTLNTGTGGKVISLVRDGDGNIAGATVKESSA